MKIVIAPDSFKESLTAKQAAQAIKDGFTQIFTDAECICVPLADGGEGTTETLIDACGGHLHRVEVIGPLGKPCKAKYGILNNGSAIIEMAEAAGLHLLSEDQRDPRITTTFGVGELILDALDKGIKHILLGIGGSATNDGGAGMLQALGVKLLDKNGNALAFGGGALANLHYIDISKLDSRLTDCRIEVICDVDNPLLGKQGASAIYGPQKGATPKMIDELDNALVHFADTVKLLGFNDCREMAGAGAAGGLGYALKTFLAATLRSGIDSVIEITNLTDKIQGADLIITGEGRMDEQTRFGKVPWGVLQCAHQQQIPVIGLAGCLGKDANSLTEDKDMAFVAIFPIIDTLKPLKQTLESGYDNLYRTARNVAAVWKMSE